MNNMQDTASQTPAYWKIKRVFRICYTIHSKGVAMHCYCKLTNLKKKNKLTYFEIKISVTGSLEEV